MKRFVQSLLVFFFIVVVLPGACLSWSLLRREPVPKNSVLHITLDGPLADVPQPTLVGLLGGRMPITLQTLCDTLRRAQDDSRIVGLLLDIKTGGLGLAQTLELIDAVDDFRRSKKWSAAYVETVGDFTAGDEILALAASCEHLYLAPPGNVFLGGLISEVPFLKKTFERLKVGAHIEQRYEYKNFANTYSEADFTPAHREALTLVQADLQEILQARIAQGRHVTPAQARSWVDDAPFSARQALAAGVVDQVAYFDEVLDKIEEVAGRSQPSIGLEGYLRAKERPLRRPPGEPLALIVVAGAITGGERSSGPLGARDNVGSDALAQAFRDAREDEVRAVVVRIDSPGGGVIASDVIRREVQRTREAGIPVVVSMGNVAASGGYYVACDADHIVAQPGTITGSIGVLAMSFSLREAIEHFTGAHVGVVHSLPRHALPSWLDPPSDAERARLAGVIDQVYRDFVTKVASGRHRSYEDVHKMARGHIWSGRQALALGLVDELGGVETALGWVRGRLALAADAPLQLRHYPSPDSTVAVLRSLMGGGEAAAMAGLPAPLRRLWRAWAPILAASQPVSLMAPPYFLGSAP